MSRKIVNKLDKRFITTEKRIIKAVLRLLPSRKLDMRVIDICREAKITLPTIHSHYSDTDAILKSYEDNLQKNLQQFVERTCDAATKKPQKITIFIVLLEFIAKHSDYFRIMAKNKDREAITTMFDSIKPLFLRNSINKLDYNVYVNSLITIIYYWIEEEKFNKERIHFIAKCLTSIRIMHVRTKG